MSTVEFAFLLPFLALLGAGLLVLGYLFYRTVCQSHAAFAAARRCAVETGGANAWRAETWIRQAYIASSMPGEPEVTLSVSGGDPRVCTVGVRDRFRAALPTAGGRLGIRMRQGAWTAVTAVGTGSNRGGDNEL